MSIKRILLLFIVLMPLSLTAAYIALPTQPMGPSTTAYEKHFKLTASFPFLIKYYLLKPPHMSPGRSYPLLLVLHGANRTTYPGHVVSIPDFQKRYPAFVVVPIAPIKSYWDAPFPEAKMGGWFPAINHAVNVVKSVQEKYNVDPSRIYVTGNSMGGFGTFGAVAEYPDLFAAAVPTCGGWDSAEAPLMRQTPIWAFHGARDPAIPVANTRRIVEALKRTGGNVKYTEYPDAGHECHMKAYTTPAMWDWMFSRRR